MVEAELEGTVSLDYGGQDDLLALGIVPVPQRYRLWCGSTELGDSTFALIEGGLNREQVAAVDPDLILAL